MSNFPGYKTKAFSESQKFFVLDPNTGSPSFVLGSDLVNQITPNSNYVYSESTRTTAQATDYAIGSLVQTAGATSAGDNFAATYLVVASGAGDFPMDNGNELLVIKGDEFLREQLATAATGEGSDLVVKPDTGETVTAELDKRTIYVGSVAEDLSGLTVVEGQQILPTGWHSGAEFGGGPFVGRASVAKSSHDGIQYISPTVPPLSAQAGATFNERMANFLSGAGETDATGSGVFERVLGNNTISGYDAGVVSDNSTDDEAAWNALFGFIAATRSTKTGAGGTPSYSVYKVSGTFGTTLTSKPVIVPAYFEADFSRTRFERHPDWAEVAGTYLLDSTELYQAHFGGLSFHGTDYCLNIENANLDQGSINVTGVQFSGGDHAIRVEATSSIVTIEHFKSDKVPHFLDVISCDRCVLDKGWISQGALTTAEDATINNTLGLLVIKEVLGVPIQHSAREVAWINNYAAVDVRGMRFGGEPGSCAAVNNFAEFKTGSTVFPTMVSVIGSETYSVDTQGGTQTSCIVRLFKLPNIVRFNNNRGAIDTEKLITWGSTTDQAAQIATYEANSPIAAYSFNDNQKSAQGNFDDNLAQLFSPSGRTTLTASPTGVDGETKSDSGIVPARAGQYSLVFFGNPRPTGGNYRSTWRGEVNCFVGFNGSALVKRLSATLTSEGVGGPSFASSYAVTPVFWNGTTEATEVADSDTSYEVRLKVTGWQTGNEGSGFGGYIVDDTP